MARKPRLTILPPEIPAPPETMTREFLAQWQKDVVREMERFRLERESYIRNGYEHPLAFLKDAIQMQAGLGLPKSMIAKMYGITQATIDNCYGEEFELGKILRVQRLARSALGHADFDGALALKILERSPEMEEYQQPVRRQQDVPPDNKTPIVDSSRLSQEERAQLEQLCLKALGENPPETDTT